MYICDFIVLNIFPFFSTYILKYIIRFYIFISNLFSQPRVDKNIKNIKNINKITTNEDIMNDQHYENDPLFFGSHLGSTFKYSASEWLNGHHSIEQADNHTLDFYQLELSELKPGSFVLEVGCGWGSLTLHNARKFKHLNFVSFSNSNSQIEFIKNIVNKEKLSNVILFKEDFNKFCSENSAIQQENFSYAFAIESLEHAINTEELLHNIGKRLKPGGKLFVQSIIHARDNYIMDNTSWMGRNFFTGGQILKFDTYLEECPKNLINKNFKFIPGHNYSKSLYSWLDRLEMTKNSNIKIFGKNFYNNFRAFYLISAEAFRSNNFFIGYYFFSKN